jgi:quercetin dioxygenase-like cupin family protein
MMSERKVIKENAFDLKSLNDKKFNPKVIYQTDEIKVVLAYFKEGQFIPVHTPGVDVVLCILEGEAEVVTGEEKIIAKQNDLIIVPKGIKRGVKALTELSVLHVVQPPPSEEDHKEVHEKIAAGKFE